MIMIWIGVGRTWRFSWRERYYHPVGLGGGLAGGEGGSLLENSTKGTAEADTLMFELLEAIVEVGIFRYGGAEEGLSETIFVHESSKEWLR